VAYRISRLRLGLLLCICLFSSACQSQPSSKSITPSPGAGSAQPASTELPRVTPINPLTGQPVVDPSLLKIPAVLLSITNFPAIARPQSGLSFAPFVYEYYITEGATRFLAVFYGQLPAVETPVAGGCETRTAPFVQTATLLGNLVWLDSNRNGLQDPGEGGISGLCVNLYDKRGDLIDRTSTDSNGDYGFNVDPGQYTVEFVKPTELDFTFRNVGDAGLDSDPDPANGRVIVNVTSDTLAVDAGLVPASNSILTPPPASSLPPAQVGPIRSGRLIYQYIAHYFQNSCLIFGSASPEVLVHLPQCLIVFHELAGGGFMLDLKEMESVAAINARKKGSDFDYSGNTYAADPPPGGAAATKLQVYIAYQNQSAWEYDPLYQGYMRYVDTSDYAQAGVLHADTDRLTGRQLHVENIIVLYAQHEVVEPTNVDIHLDPGKHGKARLFRDGQIFQAEWRTESNQDEAATGIHPIRFLTPDDKPLPLKPGHTWILVVTPETTVEQTDPGTWDLTFFMPPGAK
jgi:hypothetical protein